MAGFTAERDMGTEGAGSADTAVRNAIDDGLIPGPRLRISGNAIDILGGHEDANKYNPAQHVLSNATYANNKDELVAAIRQQFKEGADFIKIFPADGLGPSYIKTIRAPLPHLRIVPTGGVDLNNATDFLKAGCAALGVGSSLITREILAKDDWPSLTRLAGAFKEVAKRAGRG